MFDLELSKEQKMIKEEVAKLVKNLVTEQAKEWDMTGEIPMEPIQKETYGFRDFPWNPLQTTCPPADE